MQTRRTLTGAKIRGGGLIWAGRRDNYFLGCSRIASDGVRPRLRRRPLGPAFLLNKEVTLMTRRSVVRGLAGLPLLGGLLVLAGCEEGGEKVPQTGAERQEKAKPSMDYMRQQYEAKSKKK